MFMSCMRKDLICFLVVLVVFFCSELELEMVSVDLYVGFVILNFVESSFLVFVEFFNLGIFCVLVEVLWCCLYDK